MATTIGAGFAMPKAAKEEMVRSLIHFMVYWLPRFSSGGNREVNDERGKGSFEASYRPQMVARCGSRGINVWEIKIIATHSMLSHIYDLLGRRMDPATQVSNNPDWIERIVSDKVK